MEYVLVVIFVQKSEHFAGSTRIHCINLNSAECHTRGIADRKNTRKKERKKHDDFKVR